MSSTSNPRIYSYFADGSITKGKAVKIGSDKSHVVSGSTNTDRCLGILQNSPTAAEDVAEVALPGGGAKGLLGEGVSAMDDLVANTDGTLVKPNAEGDQIIARAMQDGSTGDLIAVEVYYATAHASQ